MSDSADRAAAAKSPVSGEAEGAEETEAAIGPLDGAGMAETTGEGVGDDGSAGAATEGPSDRVADRTAGPGANPEKKLAAPSTLSNSKLT
jgi:hypothetical protein